MSVQLGQGEGNLLGCFQLSAGSTARKRHLMSGKPARVTSGMAVQGVRTMGHSSCAFLCFADLLEALFYGEDLGGGGQGSSARPHTLLSVGLREPATLGGLPPQSSKGLNKT